MAVGVLKGQIKFKLGARNLTLDYRKVPFQAWGELKQAAGFTQKTFAAALLEFDLDAVVGLIWLERKQRERKLRFLDVYQELQADDADEEFELVDIIFNGTSLSGQKPVDAEEEADPTAGS